MMQGRRDPVFGVDRLHHAAAILVFAQDKFDELRAWCKNRKPEVPVLTRACQSRRIPGQFVDDDLDTAIRRYPQQAMTPAFRDDDIAILGRKDAIRESQPLRHAG